MLKVACKSHTLQLIAQQSLLMQFNMQKMNIEYGYQNVLELSNKCYNIQALFHLLFQAIKETTSNQQESPTLHS